MALEAAPGCDLKYVLVLAFCQEREKHREVKKFTPSNFILLPFSTGASQTLRGLSKAGSHVALLSQATRPAEKEGLQLGQLCQRHPTKNTPGGAQ